MSFYIGYFKDDAANTTDGGWLVGSFMADGPQKVAEVEIKYWEFEVGLTNHPTKTSKTFECTFILAGEVVAFIGDEEFLLTQGQYIVLPAGVPNNLVRKINKRACGLTIKAPSDPKAKQVVAA